MVDLRGLEPPRYYDFPPAPQAGACCQFRHRSIEIDEGFGTRTQSCVYLRWCFPHLYVRTTGIGCPDRVICPLSWRTKMLPYLLLAGSSAFVTAKRTAIHHASPVPSLKWSEWRDSNPRHSAPKADALARLSYTPFEKVFPMGLEPIHQGARCHQTRVVFKPHFC